MYRISEIGRIYKHMKGFGYTYWCPKCNAFFDFENDHKKHYKMEKM